MKIYTLLLVFFLQILSVGILGVYRRLRVRIILLNRMLKPFCVQSLTGKMVHVITARLNGQQMQVGEISGIHMKEK